MVAVVVAVAEKVAHGRLVDVATGKPPAAGGKLAGKSVERLGGSEWAHGGPIQLFYWASNKQLLDLMRQNRSNYFFKNYSRIS